MILTSNRISHKRQNQFSQWWALKYSIKGYQLFLICFRMHQLSKVGLFRFIWIFNVIYFLGADWLPGILGNLSAVRLLRRGNKMVGVNSPSNCITEEETLKFNENSTWHWPTDTDRGRVCINTSTKPRDWFQVSKDSSIGRPFNLGNVDELQYWPIVGSYSPMKRWHRNLTNSAAITVNTINKLVFTLKACKTLSDQTRQSPGVEI